MLRDRIVCGINDPCIQRRLLAESELTYKSAFELARSLWKWLNRILVICKQPHLEVSHVTNQKIFTIRHEHLLNHVHHPVSFVIAVEVTIKLQIASTRMLFVIPVKRKGISQGYVASLSAPANTEAPRNRKQQRQQANSQSPAVPPKKDTKTTKTHHLDAGSDQ